MHNAVYLKKDKLHFSSSLNNGQLWLKSGNYQKQLNKWY